MAEIKLEQLTKIYPDGTKAVDALDLEIADGELVVLVGPSGCGKTSALRMVAGLEDITEGRVSIGGRVVNKVPPKDRDIAMIFQNYALYPHMTAAKNMGFALRMRKFPKGQIRERVTDTAGVLGLMQALDKRPRTLSGGQRQRVAMGRAIVREPQAFLMDEPLSNLDAKLRVEMRAEIARLQRDLGVTTIYVTHDQTEAMTLGDRVAVMRDGVLQQLAPPQELYREPRNLFVAESIGSPAMNFMPAKLQGDTVQLPIGEVRLSGEERNRLGSVDGERPVIVGVRPESFEDASLLGSDTRERGTTVRTKIDLVESLGAEDYVYFDVQAEGIESDELQELAQDSGAHEVPSLGEGQVVARVDAASRIKRGEEVELWVDSSKLHFFDPSTGRNLAASQSG